MYIPFLYLKNGFEEGTIEIASRSYPVNTKHLSSCVLPLPPSSFPTPSMYLVILCLSCLQPLWILLLSCVGIGTTF